MGDWTSLQHNVNIGYIARIVLGNSFFYVFMKKKLVNLNHG